MLKRNITYENFDGEEETDVFYFNLSKPELLEMEVENNQGMAKIIQRIIDTKDHQELIKTFKDLILRAYGVRSEDGKRFIKNEQVREEFAQTAAFPALFMDLATNDESAVVFLDGILPRDMQGTITLADVKANIKEKTGEQTKPAAVAAPVPPTNKG